MIRKWYLVFLIVLLTGCGVRIDKTTFLLNETKVQGSNTQVCAAEEAFGSLALVDSTDCVNDSLVEQKWTIKNDGGCTCFAVDAATKITLGEVACTTGTKVALTDATAYFSLMCGTGDPKISAPIFTLERILVPVVDAAPTESPIPTETPTPTPAPPQ